ncbi:MAG: DUF433 domain-containing protein [Acidobacteria bacterium]|nr:DUF433 domain-containing protein [Acidobacteriota bacterium]
MRPRGTRRGVRERRLQQQLESRCPVVESIPGKVSGVWVFRGTRVPVSAIFENLKCSSMDEVLENFPVTRDQVQAVLEFAARSAEASRAA